MDDGTPVTGDLRRALGHNLRAQREARRLTQEAFADWLGVHRTYMGAIERGERNLTLQSVERLAGRLGVEPVELLRSEERRAAGPRSRRPGADRN
jgi:transcriptional regulator with XRE-family HTH domain